MRISDWSSDVCSSDLSDDGIRRAIISHWAIGGPVALMRRSALDTVDRWSEGLRIEDWDLFLRLAARDALGFIDVGVCARSAERRVGKECVSTCRSRWSPDH